MVRRDLFTGAQVTCDQFLLGFYGHLHLLQLSRLLCVYLHVAKCLF